VGPRAKLAHTPLNAANIRPDAELMSLILVICIRNRVPGPGSKIHYPVPNPGNWYLFLHSLLMKNAIVACLCISLCDDFDFPLFCYDRYYFRWRTYSHLTPQLWIFNMEKNVSWWKIFGNCLCSCHCIVMFHYLIRTFNRVRVPG